MRFLKIKKIFLTGALFVVTNISFAVSLQDVVSPSVEQLKQLQLEITKVDSFEPRTQQVNFSALLQENDDLVDRWYLIVVFQTIFGPRTFSSLSSTSTSTSTSASSESSSDNPGYRVFQNASMMASSGVSA